MAGDNPNPLEYRCLHQTCMYSSRLNGLEGDSPMVYQQNHGIDGWIIQLDVVKCHETSWWTLFATLPEIIQQS
jgi:hypothetical protein